MKIRLASRAMSVLLASACATIPLLSEAHAATGNAESDGTGAEIPEIVVTAQKRSERLRTFRSRLPP